MFRAPSQSGLPHISTMLDDIPAPLNVIARHLGISESTLKAYRKKGDAPRPIMLALFWETRWGISAIDVDAFNSVTVFRAQAKGLQDHVARLSGIIWRLENERENLRENGANSPFYKVV